MVKIMNEQFEKQMKELLNEEFADFIKALSFPSIKGFYTNPSKKRCYPIS